MIQRPTFDLYTRYDLSIDRLRDAIRTNPEVRAEAQAELAAVAHFDEGGPGHGRCIMSKEYAQILRKALA